MLRKGYRAAPELILAKIREIAGLPGVTIDQPHALALALEWLEEGMDFADALHLAQAEGCTAFLSFDRKLARLAVGRSSVPVEEP